MRILVVVILFAILVSTCQDVYETSRLTLYGMVLPGKTDENTPITIKYMYEAGG